MFHWLNSHLLPCTFKLLFGFDCPFCGFQRALLLLMQGQFTNSFKMYPPLIPCLLFLIIIGVYIIRKKAVKPMLLKASSYTVISIIFISYFIKISFILFS